MVQDFASFIRSRLGGADLPQQQVPVPQPMPVAAPYPAVAPQPMPTPAPQPQQERMSPQAVIAALAALQQQPNPIQAAPQQMPVTPPIQTAAPAMGQAARVLSPSEFASVNGLMKQAPERTEESEDDKYEKTYVTVSYNYQGTQYYLLVPEEQAAFLPDGASLVENGMIEGEPERVKNAEQAGSRGVVGQSFSGLLEQAPPEIQGAFKTPEQMQEQGVITERVAQPEQGPEPIPVAGQPAPPDIPADRVAQPPPPTTQAPVNDQGQTQSDIRDQMSGGAASALVREAGTLPGREGYTTSTGEATPDLSLWEIEKVDPVKAGILREAGIGFVPVDQMVIRDAQGNVRLVPLADAPPEGGEIIIYGGKSEKPEPPSSLDNTLFGVIPLPDGPVGNVIETAIEGPVMMTVGANEAIGDPLGMPQRAYHAGLVEYADVVAALPQPVQQALIGSIRNTPMLNAGSAQFVEWQLQNRDIVEDVKRNGYNGYEGNEAVWERYQADRNLIERTVDTVGTDPLNVLPSMGAPARAVARRVLGRGDEVAAAAQATVGRGRQIVGEGLNVVADILDVPERALETGANAAVRGAGGIFRQLEKTPLFQQTTETVQRNAADEAETQLDDVIAQHNTEILEEPEAGRYTFDDGSVAIRGEQNLYTLVDAEGNVLLEDATWDAVQLRNQADQAAREGARVAQPAAETPPAAPAPTAPRVAQQELPLDQEPVTTAQSAVQRSLAGDVAPGTQADLSVDRPIDDLGTAPDQRTAAAQQELPTDRPIDDLGEADPMAIRADEEFRASDIGRETEAELEKWPEFMRPQTAADRKVGAGRVGENFAVRPIEAARALASEMPDKWRAFMREYGRRIRGKGGYIEKESTRQRDKSWKDMTRDDGTVIPGFDLKRTDEVLLEADHMVNTQARIFMKYFGDDAELPGWSWKRWSDAQGGGVHTATDTWERTGREGGDVPLHELTEIAIFHPSDEVAESALDDLTYRLSLKNEDGTVRMYKGNPIYTGKLPPQLRGMKGQPGIFARVKSLRQSYLENLQESARRSDVNPDRLTIDDVERLSGIVTRQDQAVPQAPPTSPVRDLDAEAAALDPEGAAQFERDLAGTFDTTDADAVPGRLVSEPPRNTGRPYPISDFTDRVYRDVGPEVAEKYLPTNQMLGGIQETLGRDGVMWVSNSPELARGQGRNSGIILEFDSGPLRGVINTRKPAWDISWRESGTAEFAVDVSPVGGVKPKDIQGALRSVRILPSADFSSNYVSQSRLIKAIDRMGWHERSLPDGTRIWTRPGDRGVSLSQHTPNQGQQRSRTIPGDSLEPVEEDLVGRDVFERDLARTAFEDAAQARPGPRALPYRATSDMEAIPMGPPGWSGRPQPMQGPPLPMQGPRALSPDEAARVRAGEATPEAYRDGVERVRQWREQTRTSAEGPRPTIGERIEARGRRADNERPSQARRSMANRNTSMREDELQSLYVRGRVPSAKQMETLGQEFSNGESLIERWDRYVSENLSKMDAAGLSIADAESQARVRVLNDWATENLTPQQKIRYDNEFAKAKKQKNAQGSPKTDVEAQIDALENIHDRAGRTKFGYKYDNFMSALREVFLYNALTGPRYIQTQMLGNTITAILTKHYGVVDEIISPRAVKKAVEQAVRRGEAPPSLMREVADQYGLGGRRQLVTGGNAVRDQTSGSMDDAMRISKIPGIGKFTGPLASKTIRDVSAMFDVMPREALWAHIMDTNMLAARKTLRERMLATAPAGRADEIGKMFDTLPQRFSASDVREAFGEVDAKWADRHARDWQEALSKTDKAARDEVKRVFFDGGERNIDRHLKRVFFFHYWMSRATPLYTEAIIRDPVYFYNYLNLLDEMNGDDDLSGSDFVKWFSTPMGYATLIRPDAFFQAFGSFYEDAGYTPDGENWLGAALRKSPVMVNPIMQMIVNMAGMSGDTFAPDPLGLNKFIQFGQAGVDYANATFGWGLPPVGNASDQAMTWLRSQITGTLDFLPGINEVPYSDPMAYKDNEVRAIVAQIGLERGLPVDDPVVQAAMVDPESEMYQEAMKRYSQQDLLDIALRILPVTAVLYPKSQYAPPKERTRAIEQGRDPATGDYSDEALGLMYERNLIAAPDEYAQQMVTQEQEYAAIGTPEERGATRMYYSITFASAQEPITVGGVTYQPTDLQAMEESDREALADQWAAESGNTERVERVREERKAYREAHPEYAAFTDWRNQTRDYPGGVVQWWQDVIEGNPNAARWYNGLNDDQKTNEMTLTSVEAWMAFQGEQLAYWEPAPTATRSETPPGPYNPIGGDDGGGSGSESSGERQPSGPTKERIVAQIEEYNAAMQEYNMAASRMLGQSEVINVDWINPVTRQAVIANLASQGIERPRMGGYLYDYLQWAEATGNTSIDAYLVWYEQQNPREENDGANSDSAAAAD